WFEKVVQPATAMELVRQYPLRRINRHPSRRPFANGQFILFRRQAYDAIGGHAAVKSEMFEDVRIAQHAGRQGLRLAVFLAAGMLHCRMYKDWAEFRRGWNRIYSESCNRKVSRLRTMASRVRILGTLLPLAALGSIAAGLLINHTREDLLGPVAL